MSPSAPTVQRRLPTADGGRLFNKVPEVTVFFWVIKILCTTVGVSAADYLNESLSLGLTYTSYLMSGLLVIAIAAQFSARRYVPPVYWTAVVLTSVVGTLLTDNLTQGLGVPLPVSTVVFTLLLAGTFIAWFTSERTLSIHTIFNGRREGFYWLTVLLTFALGTAAGDLVAQRMDLGHGAAGLVFGAVIVLVTLAWWRLRLNAVVAFWVAFILTRPLGASIGDLTSQSRSHGGLGLGTMDTSLLFLTAILVLVAYLSVTKRDAAEVRALA